MPQPSVRSLDDGRLLRLCELRESSRLQATRDPREITVLQSCEGNLKHPVAGREVLLSSWEVNLLSRNRV